MGKHWMTKFQFGKTRENIGKTSGKNKKTINNTGKYWMTKFFSGKHGKTLENMQKHAKTQENNKNIGKY